MTKPQDDNDARIGRPARISREAIAEAALVIGLDQVTVQKIAQTLGVDHSSLYRHVRGRQDILMAAADLAIARLDWQVDTDDWRQLLRSAAHAVWALYQANPGLAEAIRNLDETPPSGVMAFARTVQRLEACGFSLADALLVVDSIMDMTADSVSGWHQMLARQRHGYSGERVMAEGWQRQAGDHPALARQIGEMGHIITGDPLLWWQRKLELLIGGAARMLTRE